MFDLRTASAVLFCGFVYSFANLLAKYDANKPFVPVTTEDIR